MYSLDYTTSFGGDVKPSVPGSWLVLALSCLVAKWLLKCWTADQEVPGSGPTGNRDFFLFRVHSALTQKVELRRSVTFVSIEGDIKPLVP